MSTQRTYCFPARHMMDPGVRHFHKILYKLKQNKDNYTNRLRKAWKLSENITFKNCLRKFTTLSTILTVKQFRQIIKDQLGRRFTLRKKLMALTLYRKDPPAYRWLSKIFSLPSLLTLRRFIHRPSVDPGLNRKQIAQLKKRVDGMKKKEKLCIILFDEMKIGPKLKTKKYIIDNFVTTSKETKIVDHVLVFMLRGINKKYRQTIAYTFCTGSTPKEKLKLLIKNAICELQSCGLEVLATICDQAANNVNAINELIQETQDQYLQINKDFRHESFEVNGQEVIPLFDVPHLIKGIRNNLITKNLKCTIDNVDITAKWDHIISLYNENPSYMGIKLIPTLTQDHLYPKNLNKIKIRFATQVFSKTFGKYMGFLAEHGILPKECRDTAEVLLFFDELFDSLNGSYKISRDRSDNYLLRRVTRNSKHVEVWRNAIKVLCTMKFVTNEGREGTVPSVSNWIRTLENIIHLSSKLFDKHNLKYIWMQRFTLDPLENILFFYI